MNINEETATKIMGWQSTPTIDGWRKQDGEMFWPWEPDKDRNQSRMVVQKTIELLTVGHGRSYIKAIELMGLSMSDVGLHTAWMYATPEQECLACLRAIEKAQSSDS